MSTESYLPPKLSEEAITRLILSLDLPHPKKVESLEVAATFHSIYLIHFSADVAASIPAQREPDESVILVLRVSGHQLPRIKTQNEVGVMSWVRANTKIPVPAVVRYDASENNLIRHEFTLLEKARGVSVDKVYTSLTMETKIKMVHTLTDYLVELHSHPWTAGYVGGLVLRAGDITPGPPIDETYWQIPDLVKYWGGMQETIESLNSVGEGGYESYVAFNVACLERYVHAIEVHPALASYRDLIPRVRSFISALRSPRYADELNDVVYVLAHKDLHFANIMCDPDDPAYPITAVLDWEFSGVVPAPRWNPPRAFLWNMKWTAEDKAEQTYLEEVFEETCREKGVGHILDQMKLSTLQQSMQTAVNHLRAIVEVCPRGQAMDKVAAWREAVESAMGDFGV